MPLFVPYCRMLLSSLYQVGFADDFWPRCTSLLFYYSSRPILYLSALVDAVISVGVIFWIQIVWRSDLYSMTGCMFEDRLHTLWPFDYSMTGCMFEDRLDGRWHICGPPAYFKTGWLFHDRRHISWPVACFKTGCIFHARWRISWLVEYFKTGGIVQDRLIILWPVAYFITGGLFHAVDYSYPVAYFLTS